MSGEQVTAKKLNGEPNNVRLFRKDSLKVDINDLLARARQEKEKEKKDNYIFLSMIFGVVVVTGVIASL